MFYEIVFIQPYQTYISFEYYLNIYLLKIGKPKMMWIKNLIQNWPHCIDLPQTIEGPTMVDGNQVETGKIRGNGLKGANTLKH